MKLQGILNQGMQRIARAVIAQEEPMGPPMDEPEGTTMPEGGKPKVLGVEKQAWSSGGYSGEVTDIDVFSSAAAEQMMAPFEEVQVSEVLQFLQDEYEVSPEELLEESGKSHPDQGFIRMNAPETVENMHLGDLRLAVRGARLGFSGNTYNTSWWGPTFDYTMLPEGDSDEPYAGGILLIRTHESGDVRGGSWGSYSDDKAYRIGSYAEEVPWYDLRLTVILNTDRGEVLLDAEDDEAYHFIVVKDETGTFGTDDYVDYDNLMEAFDWEGQHLW